MDTSPKHGGRGAASNPDSRYARRHHGTFDDGWARELEELPSLKTTVRHGDQLGLWGE